MSSTLWNSSFCDTSCYWVNASHLSSWLTEKMWIELLGWAVLSPNCVGCHSFANDFLLNKKGTSPPSIFWWYLCYNLKFYQIMFFLSFFFPYLWCPDSHNYFLFMFPHSPILTLIRIYLLWLTSHICLCECLPSWLASVWQKSGGLGYSCTPACWAQCLVYSFVFSKYWHNE